MIQEVKGVCFIVTGSNLNPGSSWCRCHTTSPRKGCKNLVTFIWDEKGVLLPISWLGGWLWCLPSFRLSYKKNVNIFALHWPFHAAHTSTSMNTIQAITKFGQSVLLFPHYYSPDLTPWDCKLSGCVKTSCEGLMKKTMCFGCRTRRASFNTHTQNKLIPCRKGQLTKMEAVL